MTEIFDPSRVVWVFDDTDLNRLLGAIKTCEEVVIDLETTGLDEHAVTGGKTNGGIAARVALASLTLPQLSDENPLQPNTWILPLSHPDSPWSGRWLDVITTVTSWIKGWRKPVINQNMKFDARYLAARTGVDLSELIVWCTQTAHALTDENSSARLGEQVPRQFGVDTWKAFDFTKPGEAERVPLLDLGIYAAQDTYWAFRWSRRQRVEMNLLSPEPPRDSEEREMARLGQLAEWVVMPAVRTLTQIEERGMLLDQDWTRAELEERQRLAEDHKAWLANRPGTMDPAQASFAPTSNWFRAWTEERVAAGELRVAAFTDGGRPQWSKSVLLRQARDGSEVAQRLLEWRGHTKKSEYLASWLSLASPASTVHANYNIGRVSTGRLSSSVPNMQQVTGALKSAYLARPGFYIAEFDYSQIEMRVAAFISRCPNMMRAFRDRLDLHRMLASTVTGKAIEDVTGEERQAGKAGNFGLLFGMTPFGFQAYAENAYDVAFTEQEAEDMYRAFFELWDGIGQWHENSIARAARSGQIASPLGRVRRLPQIRYGSKYNKSEAERQAVNAPVQGMASDITQIGASLIAGNTPGSTAVEGARLVGTVHDSLLAEIRVADWQEVAQDVMHQMTQGVLHVLKKLGCDFDVPLEVEGSVGTRWGSKDIGMVHSG